VFCSCVKVDLKRFVFISFGNLTVHDNIWCLKVLIDVRTPKLQHVSYQVPTSLEAYVNVKATFLLFLLQKKIIIILKIHLNFFFLFHERDLCNVVLVSEERGDLCFFFTSICLKNRMQLWFEP